LNNNKNKKNNKKYDIDSLLSEALRFDEITRPEITQTPVSFAAEKFANDDRFANDGNLSNDGASGMPRPTINLKNIRRVLSTVASVVIMLTLASGIIFAALYLRSATPLSEGLGNMTDMTDMTDITDFTNLTEITQIQNDENETDILKINIEMALLESLDEKEFAQIIEAIRNKYDTEDKTNGPFHCSVYADNYKTDTVITHDPCRIISVKIYPCTKHDDCEVIGIIGVVYQCEGGYCDESLDKWPSDYNEWVNFWDARVKSGDLRSLSAINPDFVGWIEVSNTTINYPVVQTTNNDFYLVHNFDKKYTPSGAIFVDYRNNKNIRENRNTIIYGHNMLNGEIFQPLIDFSKREDYFKDGIIEIIVENAIYNYEIFSVHEENTVDIFGFDEMRIDFDSDEEFVEYLREMQELSIFQKDVNLDENSQIITLVTMVNDIRSKRCFVVQGVLIDVG